MQELWLPVVGYEGLYDVSNWGRVRSLDKWVKNQSGAYFKPGRILKLCPGHYPNVKLSKAGVLRTREVHVLVAEAFLGPCPEGMEVCHGPGGKKDNRLCNLSYGTHSQNQLDKYRDGTMTCGEKRFNAVLTAPLAREIKLRHKKGEPCRQIAEHLNLPLMSVRHCAKHRSWKHILV